ncbi:MAG: hypothetical protein ACT4OG_07295 [Alphaproteobacteria bacterium]
MSNINLGRVILGGVVAGIIIDIVEGVVHGMLIADQWEAVMTSLNLPMFGTTEIIWFNVLGLVLGIVAVWTYAAMRPRFGAGPKTAVFAALLIWVTAYALCSAFPLIIGMYPMNLVLIGLAVGLVEIIGATLAGAWLYKE